MIPIANPIIEREEYERVQAVLESGHIADGPEVRAFEDEFADYCGSDRAVATSNGTTALHVALEALDLPADATVATTPFSFIATANAIRLAGATPHFVDVDPETFNLDANALESELRDGLDVDAVIAVHLYGLPAQMDHLAELAQSYDFALVEDAAQAHGARFDGDRVGSIGDVGCFSFYPTKNMTTGEGGMVTTDRDDVADRAEQYVNHGRAESGYEHVSVGHNFRMTSIGAAIGRAQLDRLPQFIEARQANAARLDELLAHLDVTTPAVPADRTHVYHQYTIKTRDRDRLRAVLSDRDIGTGVYYPTPIHKQPAYAGNSTEAPTAERLVDEVLSLPVHPRVDAEDIAFVADGIEAALDAVEVGGDAR
ncbi:DegT/DnrJ/EryC1/StrS family aminotransferase [Haloarchaeobius sp. DFWS5]|uniref:DegT/DnrJ/EryC1/StrS family aminotransferase n=1 Tax=Haloarchaeobius sp. DFWS5 TaxID=3446114 RepID=UPI003EBBEFE8